MNSNNENVTCILHVGDSKTNEDIKSFDTDKWIKVQKVVHTRLQWQKKIQV